MDAVAPALVIGALAEPPSDRRRAGVRIRRVQASDAALIDEFVRGLSPVSRQRRFHSGVREVPPQWLQRMTHPDPSRELALVALTRQGGREICVAEARYVLSDDVADGREFALAVADLWQGRGIGKTLLLSLGCHAARHAVPRLVGDVLHDNLPMIELARGLGYVARRHPTDPRLVRVEQSFGGSWRAWCPPLVLASQASFETQGGPT
ncbi:MAG TPA: GNAT family N-acetyltransferase [Burkholderiaceae bacterium]|nr:GNAT family N-acetyltransferase [Burkholderiaceae bacterium]